MAEEHFVLAIVAGGVLGDRAGDGGSVGARAFSLGVPGVGRHHLLVVVDLTGAPSGGASGTPRAPLCPEGEGGEEAPYLKRCRSTPGA